MCKGPRVPTCYDASVLHALLRSCLSKQSQIGHRVAFTQYDSVRVLVMVGCLAICILPLLMQRLSTVHRGNRLHLHTHARQEPDRLAMCCARSRQRGDGVAAVPAAAVYSLKMNGTARSAAFSPDGRDLLTMGASESVCLQQHPYVQMCMQSCGMRKAGAAQEDAERLCCCHTQCSIISEYQVWHGNA